MTDLPYPGEAPITRPLPAPEASVARYVLQCGPAGFKGKALGEIARDDAGLLFLDRTLEWQPKWWSAAIASDKAQIKEFLALPDVARLLKAATDRAGRAAGSSGNRARDHATRSRAAELWGD